MWGWAWRCPSGRQWWCRCRSPCEAPRSRTSPCCTKFTTTDLHLYPWSIHPCCTTTCDPASGHSVTDPTPSVCISAP
jgi:hypothetical protein